MSGMERSTKDERIRTQVIETNKNKKPKIDFTEDDAIVLLKHAEDILDIATGRSQDAWESWAKAVGLS